jgi:integral membrane protein
MTNPARAAPAPAPHTFATGSGRSSPQAIRAALLRFRVVAYVVGVGLITLVLVGVPLKYLADTPVVAETVGPLHGFLFMVYLALTVDLASRCRFRPVHTLMIMVAGTIPFLSFVAERTVTRQVLNRSQR